MYQHIEQRAGSFPAELGLVCNPPEVRHNCLLIGENPLLLATRKALIERPDFRVRLSTASEAPVTLARSTYSFVLLCRSVLLKDAQMLARYSHLVFPASHVVLLRNPDFGETEWFDSVIDSAAGPQHLLSGVLKLREAAAARLPSSSA